MIVGRQTDIQDSSHPDESEADKLDRNWNELLQELRVSQTGVQILTGFLLTVPFTVRFGALDDVQRIVYLVVLSSSVLATAFLVGPVAFHRILFRQGERPWLVHASHWCARAGLITLAATICGVVWLVFSVVAGTTPASIAAGLCAAFFAGLWGALPWTARVTD
ncbi:MAG: sodium:proton antiporter [Nocardioidaceae bacterium]|nr:sodium:proton antiporter [Nocardioidaceae bacterium]